MLTELLAEKGKRRGLWVRVRLNLVMERGKEGRREGGEGRGEIEQIYF